MNRMKLPNIPGWHTEREEADERGTSLQQLRKQAGQRHRTLTLAPRADALRPEGSQFVPWGGLAVLIGRTARARSA